MITQQIPQDKLIAMLAWQVEMGADEAVLDNSLYDLKGRVSLHDSSGSSLVSSASLPPQSATINSGLTTSGLMDKAASASVQSQTPLQVVVDHINNLPDLAAALSQLNSCSLKRTASNMCFSDGNAGARLMIIGEVPGRDEDRLGVPFVGAVGQFLDRMLASIGLDRSGVYMTNLLPWRPPGNRTATAEETEMLLPFLYRHIQLANPELVLVLGGTPAKTILKSSDNILELRGRWKDIDFGDGVMRPTMASLHPAYLMRSPTQKRLAFDDWYRLYHRLGNQVSKKATPLNT
ncbi:MAG: uracil-DNA glycosylase [Pseudomonadota bacterium]|nr:uracil-DNA glycosylase [Pseudomonadota bacterium]